MREFVSFFRTHVNELLPWADDFYFAILAYFEKHSYLDDIAVWTSPVLVTSIAFYFYLRLQKKKAAL